MKKGVIIYRSKYGATRKYAQWLRELTRFDCVEASNEAWSGAADYETIIMCGGIYASGIAGLSFLKKNMARLSGHRVFVFCVGASPYDERAFEAIRARNLTGSLREIPLFYGRGAWDEDKMTVGDRFLCRLLQRSLQKKDPASYEPWERALVEATGKACDWTDRQSLRPLLEAVSGDGQGIGD